MKKIKVILLAFCAMASIVPAAAQDPMVELPWIPTRDTHGIRTLRAYRVDTLTGERKLICTDHYDRHGFKYDSLDRLVYDAQGRLTEYVNMGYTYLPDNVVRLRESWRCNITYGPDGTVQRIEDLYPTDSSRTVYELLSHKVHPQYGLLDYTFRRITDDNVDTAFFRREYDAQGHLVHEEYNCSSMDDFFINVIYRYDASGRRSVSRGSYYESADSMNYVYDAQGVLTRMKGVCYELDMEAETEVNYRPDGTRSEEWQYWRQYVDDPDKPSSFKLSDDVITCYRRYDSRDVLVYEKYDSFITEYEVDYW